MRFPNISIAKDIGACDFLIPVSSLQPLVENSIMHGIGKRSKMAGTITIASSETNDAWLVSVSDDGVGFSEADLLQPHDGHFGLENVRKRLMILCSGSLEIRSTPGQGTTVQISIPKTGGRSFRAFSA